MSKTIEERLEALESLVDQLVKNNNNAALFIVDAHKHDTYISTNLYNEIDYIEKEEENND